MLPVVVVADTSLSMPMRGFWDVERTMVLDVVERLARGSAPDGLKGVIGYSNKARLLDPAKVSELAWDYVYGANLASALALAREVLGGERGKIILFSDLDVSAYPDDSGEILVSQTPKREATRKALDAIQRCQSDGTMFEVVRFHNTTWGRSNEIDTVIWAILECGGTVSNIAVPD